MKRITLLYSQSTISNIENVAWHPECQEIHLSDQVANVMERIIALRPNKPLLGYSAFICLENISQDNLEEARKRMNEAGLNKKGFFDLMQTMRDLAKYAMDVNAYINYQEI